MSRLRAVTSSLGVGTRQAPSPVRCPCCPRPPFVGKLESLKVARRQHRVTVRAAASPRSPATGGRPPSLPLTVSSSHSWSPSFPPRPSFSQDAAASVPSTVSAQSGRGSLDAPNVWSFLPSHTHHGPLRHPQLQSPPEAAHPTCPLKFKPHQRWTAALLAAYETPLLDVQALSGKSPASVGQRDGFPDIEVTWQPRRVGCDAHA